MELYKNINNEALSEELRAKKIVLERLRRKFEGTDEKYIKVHVLEPDEKASLGKLILSFNNALDQLLYGEERLSDLGEMPYKYNLISFYLKKLPITDLDEMDKRKIFDEMQRFIPKLNKLEDIVNINDLPDAFLVPLIKENILNKSYNTLTDLPEKYDNSYKTKKKAGRPKAKEAAKIGGPDAPPDAPQDGAQDGTPDGAQDGEPDTGQAAPEPPAAPEFKTPAQSTRSQTNAAKEQRKREHEERVKQKEEAARAKAAEIAAKSAAKEQRKKEAAVAAAAAKKKGKQPAAAATAQKDEYEDMTSAEYYRAISKQADEENAARTAHLLKLAEQGSDAGPAETGSGKKRKYKKAQWEMHSISIDKSTPLKEAKALAKKIFKEAPRVVEEQANTWHFNKNKKELFKKFRAHKVNDVINIIFGQLK